VASTGKTPREPLEILNDICLDSLEATLTDLARPDFPDGNVTELFREMVAALAVREDRIAKLERERDDAITLLIRAAARLPQSYALRHTINGFLAAVLSDSGEQKCPNCEHGEDPTTRTTCNECEGTGLVGGEQPKMCIANQGSVCAHDCSDGECVKYK
jgi:hypothetical protein